MMSILVILYYFCLAMSFFGVFSLFLLTPVLVEHKVRVSSLSWKYVDPFLFFDWLEKKANARRLLRAKFALLAPYRSSGIPLNHEPLWLIPEHARWHLIRCATYIPVDAFWTWYFSKPHDPVFLSAKVFFLAFFLVSLASWMWMHLTRMHRLEKPGTLGGANCPCVSCKICRTVFPMFPNDRCIYGYR